MKKSLVALTVVAALAITGSAFARGGMGMGQGMVAGPYAEQYKKFAAETLPIRQEMMNKHFELQKEYLKEKPDTDKISKLQGELAELRKKMIDARTKSGIPMGKMGKTGGKGMRGGMMGGMTQDCPLMTAPPPATK